MNEMPGSVHDTAQKSDNSLSSIDALRASIEQEHMFKTSLSGFNKREVMDYLAGLSDRFQKAVADRDEELKRLGRENEQLCALIDEQKEKLSAIRAEERRKMQAEFNLQEGVIENLRDRNSKLMADNHALQLRITALMDQMSNLKAVVSDRSEQLEMLGGKLEMLLADKLKEFDEVINVWKTDFCDIVSAERQQISGL